MQLGANPEVGAAGRDLSLAWLSGARSAGAGCRGLDVNLSQGDAMTRSLAVEQDVC